MQKRLVCLLATLVVALFASSSVFAETLRVPQDFALIQSAIDIAVDGDTVLVAPGTYLESDISFLGKAITLRSEKVNDPTLTVVDAQGLNTVFFIEGGEGESDSRLEGFTIQNGNAAHTWTGGILIMDAQPLVSSCIIQNNRGHSGAGIYYEDNDSAEGAVFEHCTFRDNGGPSGSEHGAGMYLFRANATIRYCTFSGNQVARSGGAMYVTDSSPVVENSIFHRNLAPWSGALHAQDGEPLSFINCVIADNMTTESNGYDMDGDMERLEITSSILRGKFLPMGTASYSNIQGGWPGIGNIDADPLFASYAGFDYLLGVGSPAIDAGDPSILDGISDSHPKWPNWYPNGTRSDMGAYGGPENDGWLR